MKKAITNSRQSLMISLGITLVLLAFLFFQYQEYKTLPRVANYTTVPVNGATDIDINWRFFAIPYDNLTSESEVEVKVSPHYNHQVAFISQKEIYLRSVEDERAQLEQDAQGRFDEFVDSYFPSDKRVTVERVGESYKPNTRYSIVVTHKSFNVFYYLLGTKQRTFTFTTGTDTVDEYESRKSKFKSSLGTFIATVPTKEELEHQRKAQQTCQISKLETDYLFGENGKPERDTIDGTYYDIQDHKCDTVNFTGETVTVKLIDPRGKAEFEKFLKDNNVNPKLLKITYIAQ